LTNDDILLSLGNIVKFLYFIFQIYSSTFVISLSVFFVVLFCFVLQIGTSHLLRFLWLLCKNVLISFQMLPSQRSFNLSVFKSSTCNWTQHSKNKQMDEMNELFLWAQHCSGLYFCPNIYTFYNLRFFPGYVTLATIKTVVHISCYQAVAFYSVFEMLILGPYLQGQVCHLCVSLSIVTITYTGKMSFNQMRFWSKHENVDWVHLLYLNKW
jgi:hypothetical protein